jgi:uncharacterized protein (DUF302 family)
MTGNSLGMTVGLGAVDFDAAVARTTDALQAEGFGILTEIDVQKTIKKKLGIDVRKYKILGACNPPIAHQALAADPMIGLLLPCNVIVFEGERGEVTVSIANPRKMFELVETAGVEEMVEVVYGKLARAAESLRRGGTAS